MDTSEKQKMIAGELYDASDPQLQDERRQARELCRALLEVESNRADIIAKLFGKSGASISIEPPFFCDYGSNITLGMNVYFNFNCVILDPAPVSIGDNVFFGPAVQIYTATHPIRATERNSGLEYAKQIEIGSNVWVGGGAIICPGVKIGDGAVIGAGSVVTRNIPAGVVVAGNPCRVLRQIE